MTCEEQVENWPTCGIWEKESQQTSCYMERKVTRKVVRGDENVQEGNRARAKGDGLKNDWNAEGDQGVARKIQRQA